ncbi:hypothetical protein TNCV_2429811 [Trichonephila clavipes]|nr:hypothetical protein TNCV_2429811 [Trichonephila clavipes]
MAASSSSFIPTPLAHADNQGEGRPILVVIRGILTAQWYVEDIQSYVLLPFLLQYPGLIFQQDDARTHAVRVAMNCLTASF